MQLSCKRITRLCDAAEQCGWSSDDELASCSATSTLVSR